jgi:putative tryptophan/tyrosine transport system substrate-binding protein
LSGKVVSLLGAQMRRREFIILLGSAAAAWPLAGRAQPERMRRIGVLIGGSTEINREHPFVAALRKGLAELGWVETRNLLIELRGGDGDLDRMRAFAEELVDLGCEVIVVNSAPATRALQRRTRTIPIIFVGVGDPIGAGLVGNIARPEDNTTGFTNAYASLGGKWLDFLKQAAPHVSKVAYIFYPTTTTTTAPSPGAGYFASIEQAASALAVEAIRTPVRSAAEIEHALDEFVAPNGGLLLLPSPMIGAHRELILRLAVQRRLPTISANRSYAERGSLLAYGPDFQDMFGRAASYVDRILRGAKISELPVQFPTKFELVINLKTAKAIGVNIPTALLVFANEVIE